MGLKLTILETCPRCGLRAARIVGDKVYEGHVCSEPLLGPSPPPREHFLRNVIFVGSESSAHD